MRADGSSFSIATKVASHEGATVQCDVVQFEFGTVRCGIVRCCTVYASGGQAQAVRDSAAVTPVASKLRLFEGGDVAL